MSRCVEKTFSLPVRELLPPSRRSAETWPGKVLNSAQALNWYKVPTPKQGFIAWKRRTLSSAWLVVRRIQNRFDSRQGKDGWRRGNCCLQSDDRVEGGRMTRNWILLSFPTPSLTRSVIFAACDATGSSSRTRSFKSFRVLIKN